jgi:hypothetical protein
MGMVCEGVRLKSMDIDVEELGITYLSSEITATATPSITSCALMVKQ